MTQSAGAKRSMPVRPAITRMFAPGRLVEELLGRDRAAGGECLAGRRAAGEQGVEEILGGVARVVAVARTSVPRGRSRSAASRATGRRRRPRTRTCGKWMCPSMKPGRMSRSRMCVTGRSGYRFETSANGPKSSMMPSFGHQQAIVDEAGRRLLVADVLPRIVDEVEETCREWQCARKSCTLVPDGCVLRVGRSAPCLWRPALEPRRATRWRPPERVACGCL